MKLVASKTSPYARKIRVLLAEKQLAFEFVEESAWNAGTTVPRYNPLNKIPVLVLDDGTCLYDSVRDRRVPRPARRPVLHPALRPRARLRAPRRGARRRHRRRGHRDLPRAQARRRPARTRRGSTGSAARWMRASRRWRASWAARPTCAATRSPWATWPARARCCGWSSACRRSPGGSGTPPSGAGSSGSSRGRRSPRPARRVRIPIRVAGSRAGPRSGDHAPAEALLAAVEHRGLPRASPPTAARRIRA